MNRFGIFLINREPKNLLCQHRNRANFIHLYKVRNNLNKCLWLELLIVTFKLLAVIGNVYSKVYGNYKTCFPIVHEKIQCLCSFRDESTTVNRQPEFTQLDIELSFTQSESIMQLIENILSNSWPNNLTKISAPFKRMTYQNAMETYGSDKPDTRSTELLVSMKLESKFFN